MKNIEFSSLEDVSTQVDVVSNLLDVILEDLLYFGKLNLLDGDTLEKAKVATLCNNLPKSQALLSLAQEQINDIQKKVDSLAKTVQLHPLQVPVQPVA